MLYVLTEQAVFWLGGESRLLPGERAGGGGRKVAISHSHKGFFCLEQWSLKRKQKFKR